MSAKDKYHCLRFRRNRKWRNANKMMARWYMKTEYFATEGAKVKEYRRMVAHGAALETIRKAMAIGKELDDEQR